MPNYRRGRGMENIKEKRQLQAKESIFYWNLKRKNHIKTEKNKGLL